MANTRKRGLPEVRKADLPAKLRSEQKKRHVVVKKDISNTTMHDAAKANLESLILKHLNAGTSVDCLDADRNTPLMFALRNKSRSAVLVLLAASADITVRNFKGESAYTMARDMLAKDDRSMEDLNLRIVRLMRAKENLLRSRWNATKTVISNFVAGKSQVTQAEWDHIAALFPIKKAEYLELTTKLGTRKALAMQKEINNFNPFIQAKPLAAPARFFVPVAVAADVEAVMPVASNVMKSK